MVLPVTLTNFADEIVELQGLDVLAVRDGRYPAYLRYDRAETQVGSDRLPLEGYTNRVVLTEADVGRRPVIVPGISGPLPPGDHTWDLMVEARVSGLWTCELRARCAGANVTAGPYVILLRGR
ncbi:hypothetical protein [Pseudonocardia charpentierae]|uniref:Uncharacterized protein n=1 Tax=Pseudonocardia charpentierae TaxID=3075545 RepID=A0ABU2NI36_9PSEU|nr:hypothetical protein [Pseudonocardia sp. DSM 45834]MDT0353627.1 hypothetical protein [Pseudonocardia sp. DSM 45834]